MELIEEPSPLSAQQLASIHFERELGVHSQQEIGAEAVVILHDACYGHRYSRLRTTKSTLSMIVERPERIHASVLGASTAYVRLGGHHAGARNAPHPDRAEASPPPFKIRRTTRSMDITSSHVTAVHGSAWMSELRTLCAVAGERIAAGSKELDRTPSLTEPIKRELHEGDLYLCSESLNAFEGALGGVADAVDAVFDSSPSSRTKRAFVAIRPPGHHCSVDFPSGFCWLNNVHVGIEYAAQIHGLTHAAILDFDLHHGDGSQAIAWERNAKNNARRLGAKPNSKLRLGPDIGYYSLHDINSYPCETGDDEKVQAASLCIDNAHGQSIWNVHLQEWKTERDFWELYESRYRVLLEKARGFLEYHTRRLRTEGKSNPKAALFISAGFDASEWEGSGMQRHKVNVPTEFYARFTRDVVELAQEVGTSCDGRVISVLEGGYSDRALCSGVFSHLSGLCATPVESVKAEIGAPDGLDNLMRDLGINGDARETRFQYNKAWWSPANLTALEMTVIPPSPSQVKKPRAGPQATYATPTESFAYKVVDADKFARSISGTMREAPPPARAPTPPPPEVDWVIATQALLKLLVPADRQTKSCTSEELAGPKIKKEQLNGTPKSIRTEDVKPRQLRDRKTKTPGQIDSSRNEELESSGAMSRTSRRQTIAELPSATSQPETTPQRRASRRLSAGSTLGSIGGDLGSQPPPVPAIPLNQPLLVSSGMPRPSTAGTEIQTRKARAPMVKGAAAASSVPGSPRRTAKAPIRTSSNQLPAPSPLSTDLDALTAGLKKVTLKVGTREEHDRRQKEKLDAERRARALKAAETRKANAAAKKAAKESAAVPKPILGQIPQSGNNIPVASQDDTSLAPALQSRHTNDSHIAGRVANSEPAVQLTDMNPPNVSTIAGQAEPSDMHQTPPILSQHHPAPFHRADKLAISEPLDAPSINIDVKQTHLGGPHEVVANDNGLVLSPTSESIAQPPRVARSPNGEKLPVWSSTGTIPFAVGNEVKAIEPHDTTQQSNGTEDDIDAAQSEIEHAATKMEEAKLSIWDVPETPQR